MTGDPMQFRVHHLRDSYFEPAEAMGRWTPGRIVVLRGRDDRAIQIDASHDRWYAEEAIATVPSGSEAKILRRRVEPMWDGSDFVRYQIRVELDGKLVQGWVHRSAVEGPE